MPTSICDKERRLWWGNLMMVLQAVTRQWLQNVVLQGIRGQKQRTMMDGGKGMVIQLWSGQADEEPLCSSEVVVRRGWYWAIIAGQRGRMVQLNQRYIKLPACSSNLVLLHGLSCRFFIQLQTTHHLFSVSSWPAWFNRTQRKRLHEGPIAICRLQFTVFS